MTKRVAYADLPIEQLKGLSPHAVRACKGARVKTLRELSTKPMDMVRIQRGASAKVMVELDELLAKHGLSFFDGRVTTAKLDAWTGGKWSKEHGDHHGA